MKRYRLSLWVILILVLCFTATAVSAKWWLMGRVKGAPPDQVVTLKLVPLSGQGYSTVTSTNKFNDYAFSDMGQGPPSQYKLEVYVGFTKVKEISLQGVPKGGRVDIRLRRAGG